MGSVFRQARLSVQREAMILPDADIRRLLAAA